MPSDLIFSLREVDVRFGKKEIFKNLNLNIHRNDLIALVGKKWCWQNNINENNYGHSRSR